MKRIKYNSGKYYYSVCVCVFMREKVTVYNPDFVDLILYHVLKDVVEGTYIDVGANDPWCGSITKIFYERGWSGINIEPQKEYHDILQKDRPRDVNLCIGAGNCETELVLYGTSTLATMDRTLATEDTQTTVKVMPLTEILNENLPSGADVHFCKIDVEGFEKQVLEGLDLSLYRPWIFAIESIDPRKKKPVFDRWEYILTDNGYSLALGDAYNRYYVDNAHIHLKDRFVRREQLIEIYDAYSVSRIRPDPCYKFLKDFIWSVLQKIRNVW